MEIKGSRHFLRIWLQLERWEWSMHRNLLRRGILAAIWLNLAGCGFEPHVEPLHIPTPPGSEVVGSVQAPGAVAAQITPGSTPSSSPGNLTSADAIDLCQRVEFFGDENVGSCLAPGGEAYYVWVSPDEVLLVGRDDPNVQDFRLAALNRQSRLSRAKDLVAKWPKLGLFFFEVIAIPGSCGTAVLSALSGAVPLAAVLLAVCGGSFYAAFYTGDEIIQAAQDLVEAFIAYRQYENDARIRFCRMEGGSDAECTDREG